MTTDLLKSKEDTTNIISLEKIYFVVVWIMEMVTNIDNMIGKSVETMAG